MRRARGRMTGGVTLILLAVGGGSAAAITAPRPARGTFSGAITSAAGRYAGDHGRVVITDADLVSHASGRLVIRGRACHGPGRCLALSGRPVSSLTLKGHPIPDTGSTFTVRGSGRVAPLGAVKVTGTLQIPGFVACGHQTIMLTLAAKAGRVKLTATTAPRCAAARHH